MPSRSEATVLRMNTFVGIWIFVTAVTQTGANAQVNITVFYESLCPDSIRFIKKQLHPTYKALQDQIIVDFVPFGKAYITTKPWRISCQHGRNECLGNAVQACALSRYPDNQMQMEFVYCVMSDSDPPSAGQKCAKKLNYPDNGIEECATGEEGRMLLTEMGEKTRRFRERLSFVPTILFNDEYSSRDQKDALNNLKSVVCRKIEPPIPDQCKNKVVLKGM